LQNVTSRFTATQKKFALYDIEADAYGGSAKGQVEIEKNPQLNYVFWMEMENLHPSPLAQIDPHVFGNLKGKIDANVRVIVEGGMVDLMSMQFFMPVGGAMRRPLFDRILDLEKKEDVRQAVKALVADEKEIQFDYANLRINNGRNNSLEGIVEVLNKSRQIKIRTLFYQKMEDGLLKFILKAPYSKGSR